MSFVTVPEEAFLLDVFKSFLYFFSSESSFAGINITPNQPDIDKAMQLPTLVLKRVSDENLILTRLSGFHGERELSGDNTKVERIAGYTLKAFYQLDLLTRSKTEEMEWLSKIQSKLKFPDGTDVFASGGPRHFQEIPVLHFALGASTGTATDLKIRYRFHRDVSGSEVQTFDNEIHQYSVSVDFWCDYLKGYSVDKTLEISQDTHLGDGQN